VTTGAAIDHVDRERTEHLRPVRRWSNDRRLAYGVELLATLPVIAIVLEVAKAPRLQMLDYWHVLLRITNGDGSLYVPGLRFLQNEHPLMIPGVLYWLDAKLFGGDNRVLGYLAVLVGVLTVLLLRAALPKRLPAVVRACLVVAASALVFSLHGLHNFALGMSGVAWLTANLIAVAALLLGVRGRWWLAWAAGILACMSYGTAFAVWPALALLATMRGERWWRRLVPIVLGVLVVATWWYLRPGVDPGGKPANDVGTLGYTFLTVLGHLWTATTAGTAVVAGMIILFGYAALLTVPAARAKRLWFWWALALHAILASGMIASARIDFGTDFGLSSRYTSLSVLASLPLIVILVTVGHGRARAAAPRLGLAALAAGVLGFMLGSPAATSVRSALSETPLQAVAMRAGVGDQYGARLPAAAALNPRLETMNHYPFNDDFTLGCGGPELGTTLDRNAIEEMPAADRARQDQPAGKIDTVEAKQDASLIRGWASGVGDPVRCVVYIDATGKITGGGQYHRPRPDVTQTLSWLPADTGFAVIAPTDPDGRVVVILDSGRRLWLPGKIDVGDAPG
jgi:hypothetical protein